MGLRSMNRASRSTIVKHASKQTFTAIRFRRSQTPDRRTAGKEHSDLWGPTQCSQRKRTCIIVHSRMIDPSYYRFISHKNAALRAPPLQFKLSIELRLIGDFSLAQGRFPMSRPGDGRRRRREELVVRSTWN
jgi:hypothetical protein